MGRQDCLLYSLASLPYIMIADLDETLRALLKREIPLPDGEVDIQFEQPKREWSARLSKPTINLFLYDMRENTQLRVQQRERVMQSARNGRETHIAMKRTPFRMDCYYLITTWANESEDQHNLLGATVTALLRHPTIPLDLLEGELTNQPYKIISKLASPETLPNVSEVWSVLDNEMRAAVPLVLTITIDPWEMEPIRMVETLTVRTGQAELPAKELLAGTERTRLTIGGTVRTASDQSFIADIEVTLRGVGSLRGIGSHTITDHDGRFRFSKLQEGEYDLVVWRPDGSIAQTRIIVPDGEYDIDV